MQTETSAVKLQIATQLAYDLTMPTDVLLQVEAAILPEQDILSAHIDLPRVEHFSRVAGHDNIGERIWLRLNGRLEVNYSATVDVHRITGDIAGLPATQQHFLPGEAVDYLMPSRYCPSDQFQALVESEFAGLEGGARVAAIRDWIGENITYAPNTSDAQTDALQTYVARCGVCRDFAHVMTTMVRASGIPARFASVYAVGVQPQDFHAVSEVFLDGTWYLIDSTGMASADAMAKIGVGRDASDVSFLTTFGFAQFFSQDVRVEAA
jgi:transglutaminase-like putative cysteine protease